MSSISYLTKIHLIDVGLNEALDLAQESNLVNLLIYDKMENIAHDYVKK